MQPGWDECHATFQPLTVNEALKLLDDRAKADSDLAFIKTALEERFIEGKGLDAEGKLFDLVKEDIGDLPAIAVVKIFERVTGAPDENL